MQDTFDHFHRHIETLIGQQHYADAQSCLSGGLSDQRTRDDALLWLGVLGRHAQWPTLTQAALSERLLTDPGAQTASLLAPTLTGDAALACWQEAYRSNPTDTHTLIAYLASLKAAINQPGQQQRYQQLLAHHAIPLATPHDAALLAPYFAHERGLPSGGVWQHGNRLKGWYLTTPVHAPPSITLRVGTQLASISLTQVKQWAGDHQRPSMQLYWLDIALQGVTENSVITLEDNDTQWRGNPLTWQAQQPPAIVGEKDAKNHVTVLVPVYKGYAETMACIESVLASKAANTTPFRVLVINDASPDPVLVAALTQLAAQQRIELHHQAHNLGFIGSVNHGLQQCAGSNVILLNADTLVHSNWVDRLHAAAYSSHDIASVTPLSNNGELMSLLAPCEPMESLTPSQHVKLDNAAATANVHENHQHVTIDTGCGFCLYMRSDALAEQGGLDPTLIRGYGEETDWCYRATRHGRRHLGALNVVVAHQGGISFGDEKRLRVKQNLAIIQQRFPNAHHSFNSSLIGDPMQYGRYRLMREWLRQQSFVDLRPSGNAEAVLWPSITQAMRFLQQPGEHLALAYTSQQQLTLCGNQPHAWRNTYRLPAQRTELQADLHTLGVTRVRPTTYALRHWLSAALPTMAQRSIVAPGSRTEKAQQRPNIASHYSLIAVAGQPESLKQRELTALAHTLAQRQQATYLLLLTPSSTTANGLISSGHVFSLPLATSHWQARVEFCRQHFPFSAVLLLDAQPATLADAGWLSEKQPLPWLVPEGVANDTLARNSPNGVILLPSLISLATDTHTPALTPQRLASGRQA